MPTPFFRGIKIGLLVAVIGVIFAITPMGFDLEERYGLDIFFKLRGPKTPPPDVVIVALNKQTIEYLKQSNRQDQAQTHGEEPYEWPRAYHARLLDRLSQKGASVVVFDLFFNNPRDNQAEDLDFARSIKQSGNVLLNEWLDHRDKLSLPTLSVDQSNILVKQRVIPPIPLFADVALGVAPFPLPEGQVRQFWTFKTVVTEKTTLPFMALQAISLSVYDQYVALLKQVDPEFAAILPQDRSLMNSSKQLQSFIEKLRHRSKQNPSFTKRLLQELNNGIGRDFDPDVRRKISSFIHAYKGSSRYFNFYGGPGTIPTIPYHRFLEEENAGLKPGQSPIDVKGKVVFIGLTENLGTVTETIKTVYSSETSGNIFGVELAATAFGNLMSENFIRPLQPNTFLMLTIVWGLLIGLICNGLRPLPALSTAAAIFTSYGFVAYVLFNKSNLWLPLIVPFFQTSTAYGIALTRRDLDTYPKLINLNTAIRKLLPHTKAKDIIEGRAKVSPGGKTVFATLVNADVRGFTSMSETLSPQALHERVNEYFSGIHTIVEHHGGIVTDVAGDSMFAIWEHTQADVSVQNKALLAALAIVQTNKENKSDIGMHTRIGLHCGPVSLGFVGSKYRCDFRQVSGTGNTTERIQQFNKTLGTQILTSEAFVQANKMFLTRKIGTVELQGIKKPIVLYEVMGHMDQRDGILKKRIPIFNEALKNFEAKKWRIAWEIFSILLLSHPDDGPALYYKALIEDYFDHPPSSTIDRTLLIQNLDHVKKSGPSRSHNLRTIENNPRL